MKNLMFGIMASVLFVSSVEDSLAVAKKSRIPFLEI